MDAACYCQLGNARLVEQSHFSFPDDILALFATRVNYIGVLELCMALVAFFVWGRALANAAYIHFVDNDGAGFASARVSLESQTSTRWCLDIGHWLPRLRALLGSHA